MGGIADVFSTDPELKMKSVECAIELGDLVRDRISGLEGVVTGIAVYIFESPSVRVQPEECEGGKIIDPTWIPPKRLVIVKKGRIT